MVNIWKMVHENAEDLNHTVKHLHVADVSLTGTEQEEGTCVFPSTCRTVSRTDSTPGQTQSP
jgi:hypothetical protein